MHYVAEHDRRDHKVRGHFRGRRWIPEHPRSGSHIDGHWRRNR